jgi:hypothetical protein
MITFTRLKYLSFTHSAIYLTLIALAIADDPAKRIFGWLHGFGWIFLSLLCIYAVGRRIIPLWLGVMVAVVGGLGPFAGSIGFIVQERRQRSTDRGMV